MPGLRLAQTRLRNMGERERLKRAYMPLASASAIWRCSSTRVNSLRANPDMMPLVALLPLPAWLLEFAAYC